MGWKNFKTLYKDRIGEYIVTTSSFHLGCGGEKDKEIRYLIDWSMVGDDEDSSLTFAYQDKMSRIKQARKEILEIIKQYQNDAYKHIDEVWEDSDEIEDRDNAIDWEKISPLLNDPEVGKLVSDLNKELKID